VHAQNNTFANAAAAIEKMGILLFMTFLLMILASHKIVLSRLCPPLSVSQFQCQSKKPQNQFILGSLVIFSALNREQEFNGCHFLIFFGSSNTTRHHTDIACKRLSGKFNALAERRKCMYRIDDIVNRQLVPHG